MKKWIQKRLMPWLLCAAMIVSMTGAPVYAVEGGADKETEVISFAELPEQERTVSTGTSESALKLPETVPATVLAEVPAKGNEGEEPDTATDSQADADAGMDAADYETVEKEIDVPVEWESNPQYDGDTAGEYLFTAKLTGGYTTNEGLPKITVTVTKSFAAENNNAAKPSAPTVPTDEQEPMITVTDFEELEEAAQYLTVPAGTKLENLGLPAALSASGYPVTDSGKTAPEPEPITIDGVIWEPDSPWDEAAEQGGYIFTPVLPKGYVLAENAGLPEINVKIGESTEGLAEGIENYHPGDVEVINRIIRENNLKSHNTKPIVENDPEGWAAANCVVWDNSSPKRVTELNVGSSSMTGALDVTGLTELTYLDCTYNQLTSLKAAGLSKLTDLYCDYNQLETLEVANLPNLETLYCQNNRLTELNLSGLSNLDSLECEFNRLTTLNIEGTGIGDSFYYIDEPLTSFTDKYGHTITVAAAKSGRGSVRIYCYENNQVKPIATPTAPFVFEKWEGLPEGVLGDSEFVLNSNITAKAIFKAPLTAEMISVPDQPYNGEAITPVPVVSVAAGGEPVTFKERVDYTYSYSNNINAGTAQVTVTPTADGDLSGPAVAKEFTIVKSGTEFSGGVALDRADGQYTYGDTITATVKPQATGTAAPRSRARSFTAPAASQMALYLGDKQITEAVNAGTDGVYTLAYATENKDLAIGANTLTAKYVGNNNMADFSAEVSVTLKQKEISSATVDSGNASATKIYDGTTGFTGVALTLNNSDLVSGDTVTATADGDAADKTVATKAFTATGVTLSGTAGGYYTLDESKVSGDVTITAREAELSWSNTTLTYTGAAQKPAVTVANKVSGDDLAVTVTGEQTSVGDYTATASALTGTDAGNYRLPAANTTPYSIQTADSSIGLTVDRGNRTYTYGDTIRFTVTPKVKAALRSRSAAKNTVDFYCGETKLNEGTISVSENMPQTFDYDTLKKGIPAGTAQTIKAVYGGDGNLNGVEETVTVTLNALALTGGTVNASDSNASKVYDGSAAFNDVALDLTGVKSGDTVTAKASGTAAGTGAGAHAFTASTVTLDGASKDYYTLEPSKVSGTVTITPKDVSATGQNDNRTVAKGFGKFSEPSFYGVNGEKVTGTISYSYNGKTSYEEVVNELKAAESDSIAEVAYTFTADGNYTGAITGTLSITVKDLTFTGADSALNVKAQPVYGDSWGQILVYHPDNLSAAVGTDPLEGSFTLAVNDQNYNASDKPKVGEYGYKVLFTSTNGDFTDVEALSGTVTVEKRTAELSWSNTSLTYNNQEQKPTASLTNKITDDDVSVAVTGGQTNAGSYTATASALTGADAGNYKLPAANTTAFTIVAATASGKVKITMLDQNGNRKLDTGDIVTADTSGITPSGGTMRFHWKKTVDGGQETIGTDSPSYTLTDTDTRGIITCEVEFGGNVTGKKTAEGIVIAKEPLTGNIKITGSTTSGSLLTVSTPDNTGITGADYSITWLRDGTEIANAKQNTYTLTDQDLGKTLKVIITANESSDFTGSLTSEELAVPATAPKKPVIQAAAGDGFVTVSWNPPFDNGSALTGYTLHVSQNGADITGSPFAIGAGTNSYKVIGLTNGTTYTFMLTALNGVGGTDSDVVSAAPKKDSTPDNGNGNDSSDHGSGGSSGGSDNSGSGQISRPQQTVNGSTTITPTVQNGSATTTISDQNINAAIKAAQDAAKQQNVEVKNVAVALNVAATGANQYAITLPQSVVDTLAGNQVDSLTLSTSKLDVRLSKAALRQLDTQSGQKAVTLDIEPVNGTALTGESATLVGSRPVYDITLTAGGKNLTQFGTNSIAFIVPYTLAQGEQAERVQMFYIDETGAAHGLLSYYNPTAKQLTAVTGHLSRYAVGYRANMPAFTDTPNHWAKGDIDFVAARGLLSGTSATTFSPNQTMTRGMFVTALGRLAGVEPGSYAARSFTDVAADAYYAPYVEWAAQKNIVKGTGDKLFSPDAPVTREQMAVMMTNFAGQMGYSIPAPLAAVTFADNGQISAWAAKEVAAMQRAGIMQGKEGNRFDPQANATRAEAAAVLRRFVEAIVNPDAAQGWTTNDSGQRMYYATGKAATGWRQFGEKWYYFDAAGILQTGGWREIGGKWYYFYADGSMAVNTKVDGYEVGPDGARKES